jgi:hypothetical protein
MNDQPSSSAETNLGLSGPALGVPARDTDMSAPDHWVREIVYLCIQLSKKTTHDHQLQNRTIDESRLLAVGLAMRDADLLAHVGHDVCSAWIAVEWPESIDAIRREVCWTLSEWARREKNEQNGVVDLFDIYEPTRAAHRARVAERNAKRQRKEDDHEGAVMSGAFARLQTEVAKARAARDSKAETSRLGMFASDSE